MVDAREGDYPRPRFVGTGVDLFVYTRDEARRWSPRFREEVEAGIVLYRRVGG